MLTGKLRREVDAVWDRIWSSGVSNPLTCIEYLATLLLASRGGDAERIEAALAAGDGERVALLLADVQMRHDLGGVDAGSPVAPWRDSATVAAAYAMVRDLRVEDRNHDVVGDVFEYMLSKLSSAGHFGQFRTPRHIIKFIVDAVGPHSADVILDPACGTAGFLIAAQERLSSTGQKAGAKFIGEDVDESIARLARANVVLHEIPGAEIRTIDSLQQREPRATVVLTNPPFAGSVTTERVAQFRSGSLRTELLFIELIMDRLERGGRAGVVVPFGVLTSTGSGATYVRRRLVLENTLTAVIELPSGVFRPYTDVRTALLFWTAGGTTSDVVMARAENDGYSLDDRREAIHQDDLPLIASVLAEPSSASHRPTLATVASLLDIEREDWRLNPARFLKAQTQATLASDLTTAVAVEALRSQVSRALALVSSMEELA